jgi:hypothetical protein
VTLQVEAYLFKCMSSLLPTFLFPGRNEGGILALAVQNAAMLYLRHEDEGKGEFVFHTT